MEATWKSSRFATSPPPLPILPKLLATTQVPGVSTDLHKSDLLWLKDWLGEKNDSLPWRTVRPLKVAGREADLRVSISWSPMCWQQIEGKVTKFTTKTW